MGRFIAKHVRMAALYNAALFGISAALYSGILFAIQSFGPDRAVFVPSTDYAKLFAVFSVLSWALLGVGVISIMVLYFPAKSKNMPSHPEVSIPLMLVISCCLLFVTVGMLLSVGIGIVVFLGGREKYSLTRNSSSAQAWLLPLVTGILPAVLFLFEGLSILRSFVGSLRDMVGPKIRAATNDDSLNSEIEAGDPEGLRRADSELSIFLDPDREDKVQRLARLGYTQRPAVIAALQASSWNINAAEVRLANTQQQSRNSR